jgi:hypothetical protein
VRSVSDPIQVVVQQIGGGWFATWGPLVGVVIGAILGSLGQVLASSLTHRRNLETDRREWRRAVYMEALQISWDYIEAVMDFHIASKNTAPEGDLKARARHAEGRANASRQIATLHGQLVACQVRASLYAPEVVQMAIDGLINALAKLERDPAKELEWGEISTWHSRVLATMRDDLGIAGTVSLLPENMKRGPHNAQADA